MCSQKEILILSCSATTASSFMSSFIEKRHYERHSKMAAQQSGTDAGKLSLNVAIGLSVSSLPPLLKENLPCSCLHREKHNCPFSDAKHVLEMSKCGVS